MIWIGILVFTMMKPPGFMRTLPCMYGSPVEPINRERSRRHLQVGFITTHPTSEPALVFHCYKGGVVYPLTQE